MGSLFRQFNRVTIDERVLHRYLFERLLLGDKDIVRQLLPERLRKHEINLVVPEPEPRMTEDGISRPDLDLYLKKMKDQVPTEAKWDADDLVKTNQQALLRKEQGFCAALNLPNPEKRIKGIDYVQIPYIDLRNWFAENPLILLDETVQERVRGDIVNRQRQYWLVPIRGGANHNFEKMMKECPLHPFWAFQKKNIALANVLRMRRGDECVFLCFSSEPGQRLHEITNERPLQKITVSAWHRGYVSHPYHMRLDEKWGNFFEESVRPISTRKWPHFMGVKFEESHRGLSVPLSFREALGVLFTKNVNAGDAAIPLSQQEYDSLLQKLRHSI